MRVLTLWTVGLCVLVGAAGGALATETPPRVGSAGATVALPSGWHFFAGGVAPRSKPYADPLVRIVVSSTRALPYPQGCKAEVFRFSRGGVGLMVVEWLHPEDPGSWPRRPRHFTSRLLPVEPGRAVECWPGRGGAAFFQDHGRYFGAYLLLGAGAPTSKADEARAVLDTLALGRHP